MNHVTLTMDQVATIRESLLNLKGITYYPNNRARVWREIRTIERILCEVISAKPESELKNEFRNG
jgi:hypothetical protein